MRRALLIAAAVAAVLAGGCGGGDSESSPTAKYQDKANGACIDLNAKLQHLPVKAQQGSLNADQSRKLADAYSRTFTRTIAALQPPDSLRTAHNRLVRNLRAPAPDPAKNVPATVRHIRALRADYAALGIDVCKRGADQAIATYARG